MSQNNSFFFGADPGYPPTGQAQQNHLLASDPPLLGPTMTRPQQAAFQQNAQIAGADLSALEGISPERLAAIARLFQSGALQMPPPAPSVSVQHAHTSPPPSNIMQPVPIHPQVQQPSTNLPRSDIDMDTEEGEVDENEENSTPSKARDFLRPPPTGPRNRSLSPRARLQNQSRQKTSSGSPFSSQAVSERQDSQHAQSHQATANEKRAISNHDAAKMFVLEMVNAGYSYEDILPDIRNTKSLISMFRELGLPTSPPKAINQSSQPNATASVSAPAVMSNAKPVTTEAVRKSALPKRPAPAKPAPVDRSEYLARLQAAKNKKTETTTTSEPAAQETESSPSEEVIPSTKAATQSTPSISVLSSSVAKPLSAAKAAKMTELARQKLEALKAKQAAAKQAASQSNEVQPKSEPRSSSVEMQQQPRPDPSLSQGGLGAGLAEISSQVAQGAIPHQAPTEREIEVPQKTTAITETIVSPTPQTPSRSFSSLPGLFMSGSLPLKPTTMSPAPLSGPRKRAVAADFDDIPPTQSSVKRPFGQSRNASEDESLVIQVSDDEDEDNDDAMDVELAAESSKPILQTKSFRDVGPLRDFPPKATLQAQPSTPTTPGGVTYQQKMKEIEDMKRQIAQRQEKKQKGNGSVTPMKPVGSTPFTPSPLAASTVAAESYAIAPRNTAAITATERLTMNTSTGEPHTQATPPIHPSSARQTSLDKPKTAAQLAKDEERELLRKRLLELEHEVEDLGDPVQTSETRADADSAMSRSLPDTALPLQSDHDIIATESNGNVSASEEGEISDGSMSKFYNLNDSDDVQNQSPARRSGSHTSTASPSDDWEEEAKIARDGTDVENTSARDSMAAAELETSYAMMKDVDMDNGLYDPATAAMEDASDQTESMDEDETEDDSGEEDSEPNDNTEPDYLQNGAAGAIDGDHLEGVDSPSSSQAMDAQEPSPMWWISEPGRDDTKEKTVADIDVAPEIQPHHDEVTLIADQIPAKPNRSFTPYHSPLAAFKDYRYHAEYLNTVSGGYKSITYSNNIDPHKPLCPFETAGGQCNDKNCQYQHFKSLVISDNELFKIMGTKDAPAHTPEEVKKWNEGLGAVVRELRDTNLAKNANAIAARIAQFRRDFVDDPTKILNLG